MPGRTLLAELGLAVVAVCLTLGALELVGRLTYQPDRELSAEAIWSGQQPDAEPRFDFTKIGGMRFRDAAIDASVLGDDVTRMLFLGDSFTEGHGLERNEDRFPSLIAKRLARESGTRVDVFNAGVSGTAPNTWSGYLELLLPAYRPHAVVAVFFLRDGTLLTTSLRFNKVVIDRIVQRYEQLPLYESSRLLRTFYNRMAWRDFTSYYDLRLVQSYLGGPQETTFWRFQQNHLKSMRDTCREEGIPFLLVIFPLLFDFDDYRYFDIEREIERFAEEEGIPVASLTSGFLGRDAESLWVASNDQHPNEEGHRIAADTLYPHIQATISGLARTANPER